LFVYYLCQTLRLVNQINFIRPLRTSAIIIFFNFLFASTLFAQNNFQQKEKELKILGDSILKGSTDSVRAASCTIFTSTFETVLKDSGSFNYTFDSLKNVSVLESHDKSVRIFSWMLPSISKDKYNYFGFVQLYDKKLKKAMLYKLEEDNLPNEEVEKKSLSTKNWFGALYYKIIENKINGNKIYSLLGWRGNSRQTTMKVIDVLVTEKEIPKFGAPIFKTEHGVKHRIIFEYTSQAVMSLRYNEKKKMIVLDNLSPSNPDLKGKYEYYGPDMSYDAFKFKSGKWNYFKNIQVGNVSEYDGKTQTPNAKHKEFYTPPK
jgi:hypothetical protein